jgi:protein-S-isoprenylcysteine O-methyltransferase Ste14
MIIKAVIFLIVSIIIIYFSRASINKPQSHGFYRFFAWESIAASVLLNIDSWFTNPFSVTQIISWILLVISLFLIIHGIILLRKIGKPNETRGDSTLLGLEKTTRLVVEGAYRYIRHPFYSSLLFLAWGVFLKSVSIVGLVLAVLATIFLVLTGKFEEKEDIRYFGSEYLEYMKRTKMFIPFIF